jgi:hypothetical protein
MDLAEDPAVIAMSERLGLDEFAVVGRLHRVWSWASAHTRDGRASVTEKFIDKVVTHDGFARAMQAVGWLEITETGVLFVRWNRHNSKSAKARALDARRKKRVRKMSGSQPDKCPDDNRTKTGPEKRREEKRKEEKTTGSNEPVEAGGAADLVFSEWNQLGCVSECRVITQARRRMVATRLKDTWWRSNWLNAIARIPGARWLHENDSNWKADIDWFLRPDTAARLLEGKYDNAGRTNTTQRNPSFRHADDAESDWLVADDSGDAAEAG